MRKLNTIISQLKQFTFISEWDGWDLKVAKSQDHHDYISLEALLLTIHNIENVSKLIDDKKITEFSNDPAKRPAQIKFWVEAMKLAGLVTATSLISFGMLSFLNNPNDNWVYEKWMITTSTSTLCFSGFWAFMSRRTKRRLKIRTEKPLSEFSKSKKTDSVENISKLLAELRSLRASLFVLEADGKYHTISQSYWNADNWELGLLTTYETRKAIALSGEPVNGKIFFIRSQLVEFISENVAKTTTKQVAKSGSSKIQKPELSKKKFQLPKNYSALDKHVRFAPYLKCILREKKHAGNFVNKVSSIKRTRGLSKARTRLLNTIEFILGDWRLWLSYTAGELSGTEQTKYEKQLIDKLSGDQKFEAGEAERLNAFVNGKERQYEDWIIWLDITHPSKVEKIIDEFLNLKKK